MSDTNLYISKIVAPDGSTYYIKDVEARNMLSQGLEIKVVTSLPTADASTMGKLYLVQDTGHNPSSGSGWKDYYDEYITVNPSGTTYQWEKIGNTDVNLSSFSHIGHTHTVDISVYRHKFTPAGTISGSFSGMATTISVSGTPGGSVSVTGSTSSTVSVSPTTGNATYTPTGTISGSFSGTASTITLSGTANGSISGTTGAGSSHSHSVTRTTRYLHTVSVPTSFKSKTVLEDVSKWKLTTRSMRTVTAAIDISALSNITNQAGVAIASTGNTSVSYVTKSTGTVTVDSSMGGAVVGVSTGATDVTQGGNNIMWNAVVDAETETLSFVFKPLDTSNFVTKSSATTTANAVTISTVGTRLVSSSTTLKKFDVSRVTNVGQVSTGTVSFATGGLSASTATSNVGSLIAVPGGPTASVFYDTSSTSSVYYNLNETSTNGTAVITSVNANTGGESAHTHSVGIGLTNGAISVSGSYTPAGTVSATFDGSAVRLAGSVSVPNAFAFSGSNSTFTGSYTPAGTISASFSGTEATLTHTIYGASTNYKRLTTSTDNNPG